MRFTPFVVVAALACVHHPAVASAQEVPEALADYRITSWTGGDGVVLGAVRSIAQDQNGYLWLASEGGLVRFDGFRFATTDIVAGSTRLPAVPTRAVHVTRDGSVWTGYGEGHGVYQIAGGEVRGVHLQQQITGFVNVITEDRDGRLWVGHDTGLHRLRDGRWERIELPGRAAAGRVAEIHEDRHGSLWIVVAGGLYRLSPQGAFEAVAGPANVRAITEDAGGGMWITDDMVGFRRLGDAATRRLFEARGMNVMYDRSGNLWVTTIGQGLWQIRGAMTADGPIRVRRSTVQTGLVNDQMSAMLEDRDGNLWVASIQGLSRLTPSRVTSVVDIGVVRALAAGESGAVWAGTTTGLFAVGGSAAQAPPRRVVSTVAIRALHTARDGTVWAATAEGLHRVAGSRLVSASLMGPPLRSITSIESDTTGTLWVCDQAHGLVRIAANRAERITSATDATSARPLFTHMDTEGRLWIAFQGGTVRTLEADGRVTQYGAADGVSHTVINAIHQDSRGAIWIGGNGGVSLWRDGRFDTVTFRSEVWGRSVSGIFDTGRDLWVEFAQVGFIRVDLDEISRAMRDPGYALRYDVYNPGYGAAYPDTASGGMSVVRSGEDLWFVTGRGVSMLRLSDLARQNSAPSPPLIEGITVDERRYAAAAPVLPPRTNRLRIDYTVVNVSSSGDRVRFRYRVDGFDTNWVDGTLPRQATYANLPPGDYRFRVQASTNAANWNGAEAQRSFTIEPMFYQTSWFRAVVGLALVLAGVAAWRLWMRRVRKELAGVFAERLRLSREIHDTLLQNLVGLSLDLTAISRRAGSPAARDQLISMRRQVEEYIREVRQSIWDLRSPALDRHGLVGALRAAGEGLTSGKVGFALTVTGTPRACPSHIETHVLRIGREAIINAVRHAQAKQVQMEIGFEDRLLRLRVADDGRGLHVGSGALAPDVAHYGLVSMKERAADVGGRCTIESIPGLGVQVIAEFPLAPTG